MLLIVAAQVDTVATVDVELVTVAVVAVLLVVAIVVNHAVLVVKEKKVVCLNKSISNYLFMYLCISSNRR